MKVEDLIIEGKDKSVFATDKPDAVFVRFKDLTTAFHNIKRAELKGKGEANCRITTLIYKKLEEQGIPTHYIATVSECEQICQKVDIIPIQFIVRNYLAGSSAKMLNVELGFKPSNVVYELRYNDSGAGFPLINDHHAVALGLVTYEDLDAIYAIIRKTNEYLVDLFHRAGIKLVDFKLEFGRTAGGRIIIADEVSPDTCRLWDEKTDEILDKDRFRKDLGGVCDAYNEVYDRLSRLKD